MKMQNMPVTKLILLEIKAYPIVGIHLIVSQTKLKKYVDFKNNNV